MPSLETPQQESKLVAASQHSGKTASGNHAFSISEAGADRFVLSQSGDCSGTEFCALHGGLTACPRGRQENTRPSASAAGRQRDSFAGRSKLDMFPVRSTLFGQPSNGTPSGSDQNHAICSICQQHRIRWRLLHWPGTRLVASPQKHSRAVRPGSLRQAFQVRCGPVCYLNSDQKEDTR